ncbi:MAG: acyl--CoA ligase, partial [Gammaproteobacteria bacterium]|nr:acyl--CoA ligase [Gammaproteobacteria bacterium]
MMSNYLYTLPEKLTEIAKQSPNKIALQIKIAKGYKKYTYQQCYKFSQSIAQNLVTFGIKKGDKIAIILENRPEWVFIYFAIIFCGAIA